MFSVFFLGFFGFLIFLGVNFIEVFSFFPYCHSGQTVLYFQDFGGFEPIFKPKYAGPQHIELYNKYVQAVNWNGQWIGKIYEFTPEKEIPLDEKVPYDKFMEKLAHIKSIYLLQINIMAIIGGCTAIIILVIVLI